MNNGPVGSRQPSEPAIPAATELPFEELDFIYTPSKDVAADVAYFVNLLGAHLVFAIEATNTRVAMVDLTGRPPRILFADHLAGERPVLVYRVPDLEKATAELVARGWERQQAFDIPQGPCCSFHTSGEHRLALYQLVRPEVESHFRGRRDF